MADVLRWGIAATGSIAGQMVAALRAVEGAEVTAVGSRTVDRARLFADEFGIDRVHGSHRELCDDPDVDIVYVASPHNAHAAMTIEALEAGKHVVCEKAFAVNAGQAADMVAAARRNGRFLMEAMWTWFLPPIVEIRDRVAAGEIGQVTSVHATFSMPLLESSDRHRLPELAGGALLDLGIYPVAFARYLLGEPTAVKAVGTLAPSGVDRSVAGVLHHEPGATATFFAGLDAFSSLTAEIVGTGGIITVDPPFHATGGFTVNRHDGHVEHVHRPHRGLAHEAEHAMARIRAGHLESDVLPVDTSVAMMATLDDIRDQIGLVLPGD